MKKLLLLLILLIPIKVEAKITSHLINAEVEIAGGLRIKELIIFDEEVTNFSRTINYKMVEEAWNKKGYNPSIYNGYSIENLEVAVLSSPDVVDFEIFNDSEKNILEELKPANKTNNFYTKINNKFGYTININHDKKVGKTAFYLDYVVANVVVVHEDVLELNYTFKKFNIGADNTIIRLLIPYPEDSDEFKYWVHGPSNGVLQELVNSNKEKLGFVAEFAELKNDVNIRMTLPKKQVGIDVYLNKSNINALDKIIKLEDKILKKYNTNENMLIIIEKVLIVVSILYVLGAFIVYRYPVKSIFYLYLLLGVILTLFNLIFKFNIIYLYFITIIPIIYKVVAHFKYKTLK